MADETTVLNAKVVVDASSVAAAQAQFNAAINSMKSNVASATSFNNAFNSTLNATPPIMAQVGQSASQTGQKFSQVGQNAYQAWQSVSVFGRQAASAMGGFNVATQGTTQSLQSLLRASQGVSASPFKKNIEESTNSLTTFRRSWFDVIAVMGAFTMAGMAVVAAFKALQEAAEFRGMVMASRNMANSFGVDMQRIMTALDEASNHTLTAQEKFRLLNESMLAGGAEVADKLPQLVEIARAASIASGADFELVFQKLLLGIARGSAKLIDDARIYLRVGNVVEEYAKAHGIAAEAVDASTRTQIILNAVLTDGQKIVEAVGKGALKEADSFKQLTTSIETFENVMKNIPLVTGFVNDLNTAVNAGAQVAAMAAAGFTLFGGYVEIVADVTIKNAIAQMKVMGYTMAGVAALGTGNVTLGLSMINQGKQVEAQLLSSDVRFKAVLDRMDEAKAKADDVFKRAIAPMGIVSGGEDDPRERAQRKIAAQAMTLAEQQAATEEETNDRLAKLRDRRNELIIAAGQKMHDAELSMLQDIENLNIDHNNKLIDIALDGARKREEIAIDYSQKIEDAETDYLRDIEDSQRDNANRRIEIEQRYQERLIQIQRRFEDEYWNAVKTRDAVGLVEAVRNRNRGIQDATRQRDNDLANEDRQDAEKAQKAWITYQRKLADAQRYYTRAMQDQRTNEQRATDDENRNFRFRETELRRHYQWRLEEIQRNLQQELDEANAKYGQAEADYSAHLARMAAIAASYMSSLTGATGWWGSGDTSQHNRAEGGLDMVSSPTRFMAGEAGPELVFTVPLGGGQRALPAPASMSHTVSGDVSHQLNMITTQGLRGMEGRIVAAVMQAMRQVVRP